MKGIANSKKVALMTMEYACRSIGRSERGEGQLLVDLGDLEVLIPDHRQTADKLAPSVLAASTLQYAEIGSSAGYRVG